MINEGVYHDLRLIEVLFLRGYHEEVVGMLKGTRILEILDMGWAMI